MLQFKRGREQAPASKYKRPASDSKGDTLRDVMHAGGRAGQGGPPCAPPSPPGACGRPKRRYMSDFEVCREPQAGKCGQDALQGGATEHLTEETLTWDPRGQTKGPAEPSTHPAGLPSADVPRGEGFRL